MRKRSKSQTSKRFMRNMLSSLVLYGRVITTKSRAKLLKSEMSSVLSKVKGAKNDLSRTRMVNSIFYGGAAAKVIDEIGSYKSIKSYDYKIRQGDGIMQTIVEIEKEIKKVQSKARK